MHNRRSTRFCLLILSFACVSQKADMEVQINRFPRREQSRSYLPTVESFRGWSGSCYLFSVLLQRGQRILRSKVVSAAARCGKCLTWTHTHAHKQYHISFFPPSLTLTCKVWSALHICRVSHRPAAVGISGLFTSVIGPHSLSGQILVCVEE